MMAYAAYEPTRPLSWRHRVGIALAGSTAQVTIGLVVLLIMGVNPLNYDNVASTEASIAIWWTAVILGLLNLIPLVPLDGGAVVSTVLERIFPTRGRWMMLRFSLAMTSAMAFLTFVVDQFRGFLPFALFLLFIQYQTLNAEKLVRRGGSKPLGEPIIDAQVVAQMVDITQYSDALRYAREAFVMNPNDSIALQAARAAAATGNVATTVSWLQAALSTTIDPLSLLHGVNASEEILALRTHPLVESTVATIALQAQ
jgi:Zn-dependent protease